MRIENYSDKYFDDVVRLVESFHKEAVCEYDLGYDVATVIETIRVQGQQNAHNTFLLIVDDTCQGILYGQTFNSMVTGKLIFQEIIWFVDAKFRFGGIRLLRQAEKMLKKNGVSSMIMAVLENSKTEKIKAFYHRLGFKPMETHYVRSL